MEKTEEEEIKALKQWEHSQSPQSQMAIQNQLAFMDTLSRANGSGHKVDNEIKEVVRSLRVKTGISTFSKEVEKEALVIAKSYMRAFLDEFQCKEEYPLELILELKHQLYEKI